MATTEHDPERIPVVIASGQSIERTALTTPAELMELACDAAFADVPALRSRVDRLSVVNVMTRTGPHPASDLAARIGTAHAACEVTTIGGNSPQWLVNRAASAIAGGKLSVTVIAGAEAIRSSRRRRALATTAPPAKGGNPANSTPSAGRPELPADPVVGDDQPGVGPAESAIGLLLPVHVYPLFESVVAARLGHDGPTHRQAMGELFAPFTEVAATHPYAWFQEVRTAADIATPAPDNRVVAEPYTKRMTAFLGSDQGAALVVCSLAEAQRAGVADRAVFIWSGSEAVDIRSPSARPDPGRSPAIAAAGHALFEAATAAAGRSRSIGIDDVETLDLYSCFPSAVELAAEALGVQTSDSRGLSVTGGLPYFGGPGNNYTTHAIATLTEMLRGTWANVPRSGTSPKQPRLGLATGLGWFITKHALGLYGADPPPGGYRHGDTTLAQSLIDGDALDVALEVDDATPATVVAATVIRDPDGTPVGAPLIARLPDGRHMAVGPADGETTLELGRLDVPGLVGTAIIVQGGASPRYRLGVG
jgi:acetyl-CoA C-acetyltransferase